MFKPVKPLSLAEFVVLLSLIISILAMSTDVMLPGLDRIGRDLGVVNPNDVQLVILYMFVGFAIGQLFAGPISDWLGRKPTIYGGYVIFIGGCLMSMFAQDFAVMLAGRFLQGIGASAPRIVSMALIRDCYKGREMARIMSMIMIVFILVPTIAPFIGQVIILEFDWRATFVWLLLLALVAVIWFAARQPETMPPESRLEFSPGNFIKGLREVCGIRVTVGYSIAAGFIFGPFIGYLGASQQIYVGTFGTGLLFPLYFAITSLTLGVGSAISTKLVLKLGMQFLVRNALLVTILVSTAFAPLVILADGVPPLWLFLIWHMTVFLAMGLIFGNINALAMEPLDRLAGLGAALVGSLSTIVSLPLGWIVGYFYDGGVLSIVLGFAVLALCSLLVMNWVESRRQRDV